MRLRSPREVIETYLRAKDGNRPYLMNDVFSEDAVLDMAVTGGAISFPPTSTGVESITDVLVREFARTYENVHTFCLAAPPNDDAASFSCGWLVGMSEKQNRCVRVGCGRYDWSFGSRAPRLAIRLKITIEIMDSLASAALVPVMDWLSTLPRPWCPSRLALKGLPKLAELEPLRRHLENSLSRV
jgi:hypothetical protein